ncbi:MAG: protease modulator HflC, partial [Proteobacteria bacterium]|nr:protease modulator HflC [Pseudomonadota bacterium]
VKEVIRADKKRINVDAFARYKIVDPLEFRKRAVTNANFLQVFGNRLNAEIRAEIGKILLGDMLTEKRAQVMGIITRQMKAQAAEFGTEVVDVRIGRTDLPDETAQAVYNRMRSDRVAHAAKLRAEGEEQKLKIQALADKERTIILAEAQRQSEILRGEGEGERNRILGEAFSRDIEFFDFYRSMEAYGVALGEGTTMILSPDSDFFRFFGSEKAKKSQ